VCINIQETVLLRSEMQRLLLNSDKPTVPTFDLISHRDKFCLFLQKHPLFWQSERQLFAEKLTRSKFSIENEVELENFTLEQESFMSNVMAAVTKWRDGSYKQVFFKYANGVCFSFIVHNKENDENTQAIMAANILKAYKLLRSCKLSANFWQYFSEKPTVAISNFLLDLICAKSKAEYDQKREEALKARKRLPNDLAKKLNLKYPLPIINFQKQSINSAAEDQLTQDDDDLQILTAQDKLNVASQNTAEEEGD